MLAVLCPGQGSQTPGLLAPWLELPGTAEQLDTWSRAADIDLRTHGTTSDAETIRDTGVAQPLIVAASLLALTQLLDGAQPHEVVDVTAGHSVGEFSAAAVGGILTPEAAVGLVAHRARAMAAAAAAEPTGMSAVVGGDPDEVDRAIRTAGLHPANVNGAGQVVAAGDLESLARLAQDPPARARVIPLQVAGAFHTPYMQPAADSFAPVAADWPASDARLPVVANLDGASARGGAHGHGEGRTALARLTEQIVAPVRWDLCQRTLTDLGVTGLVELLPGGVLTGLAKRGMPGVEAVAVKGPDDLDAARDLVRRHSTARTETRS